MIRWLYDLFFTRSQWKIIGSEKIVNEDNVIIGIRYILQDQWGNIKTKKTY